MNETEFMSKPERGNPRLQRLVLRVIFAVSFIALPAIFVPQLAVEKFSVLLGFGKPPHLPLLIYMTSWGLLRLSGASGSTLAHVMRRGPIPATQHILRMGLSGLQPALPLDRHSSWNAVISGRRRYFELPDRW
ncbi:MAG: hypothetical protein ACKO8Z_08600 [Prosthecobacter sp.]